MYIFCEYAMYTYLFSRLSTQWMAISSRPVSLQMESISDLDTLCIIFCTSSSTTNSSVELSLNNMRKH